MSTNVVIPEQELPLWMRQARRGFDWGLLLIIGMSLAVGWSFFLQPGLPHTNASENYVYRTTDYVESLQEGRLYPRWSPHALNGYGAPIPHYYPPAAPYTAAILHILFTNDPVIAVRLLYIISFCLAGTMTYLLVMHRVHASAGMLAAILYIYSPYVGLISPHILGDLPGMMILALIPTLLWSIDRQVRVNRPLDFLFTILITSALWLTDIKGAIVGISLSIIFILWHFLATRDQRAVIWIVFAIILGIGLAAFYSLPALFEQHLVIWREPIIAAPKLSITLRDLLTPMRQVDMGALSSPPQLSIGLSQVLLIVPVLLVMRNKQNRAGFQMLFLLCGIIGIFILLFILNTEIWLLGPIMLCLSIGSSGALDLRLRLPPGFSRLLFPVLIMLVLAAAIPIWLSPAWASDFGDADPNAQLRFEQQGFGIATLPPGTAIPSTLLDNVPASRFLTSTYKQEDINRFDPAQINIQTQVSLLSTESHRHRFQVQILTPTIVNILSAYFEGWQATLNDSPISIHQDIDTGTINIDLPQTPTGNLAISLEATPIRTLAWGISGIILSLTTIFTVARVRRRQRIYYDDFQPLNHAEVRLSALVMLSFAGVMIFLNTVQLPVSLRQPPGYTLQNTQALRSRTTTGLEALAFQVENTTFRPGDELQFTIFWQALRFLPGNYQIQAHLYDSDRNIPWFRTQRHQPGNYPTRRWARNLFVPDRHTIKLSKTARPGRYQIAVEVYDCDTRCLPDDRLNFFDRQGVALGPILYLPELIEIISN